MELFQQVGNKDSDLHSKIVILIDGVPDKTAYYFHSGKPSLRLELI